MSSAESKGEGRKWLTLSNISTAILAVVVIAMLVNPGIKAGFIRVLMKVGLFQPNIPAEAALPEVGSAAIGAARFYTAEGTEVSLHDLKGKVVFLNFWATWCPPCLAEMPSINELHKHFGSNRDVVFIMVDVDGNSARSEAFLRKNGYDLPLALPSGNIPSELFKGTLPTTVILDKAGNIVMSHEGAADYSSDKTKDFMRRLLAAE